MSLREFTACRPISGDFSNGLTGWNNRPAPCVVDGQGWIDVPTHAGQYAAAICRGSIPILNGETLLLTFKASARPGLSGAVRAVIQAGPDLNHAQAMPEKVLDLGPDENSFSSTFTSAIGAGHLGAAHLGVAPNQGDDAVPCQSLTDDSQQLRNAPLSWVSSFIADQDAG